MVRKCSEDRSRVSLALECGLQLGGRVETDGRPWSDGGVLEQGLDRVRAAIVGAIQKGRNSTALQCGPRLTMVKGNPEQSTEQH